MAAQLKIVPNTMVANSNVRTIRTTDSANQPSITQEELAKLGHRMRVLERRFDSSIYTNNSVPSVDVNKNLHYSSSDIGTQAYLDFSYAVNSYIPTINNNETDERNQNVVIEGVPIYLVMELGALLVGAICALSFIIWAISAFYFINPLLSILGFIASCFFFAMGRVSRRDHFNLD